MREIKFRAWDGKEMMRELPAYLEPHDVNETIDSMKGEGIVLMQYTGLKDKNGKEIYEGDVLRGFSNNPFSYGDECNYTVIWGVDSWHIKGTGFSIQELKNYCNNDVEVVGNIYENKNLLNDI